MKRSSVFLVVLTVLIISGCVSNNRKNEGNLQSYTLPSQEASWILNGEPIEFESTSWYPQDGTESLLDSEVYLLGEYKGVQFFADKEDVRPFNRLYTKFGKNKFRFFKKR